MGSTNDWVREQRAMLEDGQWVVADRQTAGRGRLGRQWMAAGGNFTGSCLLRPRDGETPAHLLSFVAALALFDCVRPLLPHARLELKWPNDLLLEGGKLSGILLEAEGAVVVLGIGLNLAHAPAVEGRLVSSVRDHGGTVVVPMLFAARLAEAMDRRRMQWRASGFAAVRADWLARAHPLGTPLAVMQNGARVEGRFAGLEADGALLLDVAGGRLLVHAGDVFTA